MKAKNYLITGLPAAGKSTLAKHMNSQGYNAVDIDEVPGLCGWVDLAGKPAAFVSGGGKAWLDNHQFAWDLNKLKQLLSVHDGTLYVFGVVGSIAAHFDLFDKVILLDIDAATLENRLQHAERDNPLGREAADRNVVMGWRQSFHDEAKAAGAVTLDANAAPDVLIAQILQITQN